MPGFGLAARRSSLGGGGAGTGRGAAGASAARSGLGSATTRGGGGAVGAGNRAKDPGERGGKVGGVSWPAVESSAAAVSAPVGVVTRAERSAGAGGREGTASAGGSGAG